MRIDSPACLNCKNEEIIINESFIKINSFGVYSNQPIRWLVDMQLEKSISPNDSYWQQDSVGTLFLNLSKAVRGDLWLNLEKNETKKISIWWDMRDKYKADMDSWIEMVESE